MQSRFDLEQYLTDGVRAVLKDAARAVLKDIEALRRLLHDGRQHTAGEVRAIEIDKQYGGAEHDVEN